MAGQQRRDGDRGAVTVEAAIAVCALVAVLALCFAGITAVVDQLRCTDAAREAARLMARGEPARARAAVAEIGPGGARLEVDETANGITVRVHAEPASGLLPGIELTGEAFAVPEPGVGDEPSPEPVAAVR